MHKRKQDLYFYLRPPASQSTILFPSVITTLLISPDAYIFSYGTLLKLPPNQILISAFPRSSNLIKSSPLAILLTKFSIC